MRKIIQILVLILFVSGCSSIKQGLRNFNAYYNTFYNTKEFYGEGLRLNQRQASPVNPSQPVRIFLPPSNAGLNEFQAAIETGSSILRDHERSSYLLPALFIIGKSYYYRSEFFSALEKFQELEALSDGKQRQEALFWQGLTYLEMTNYHEGIELLEASIDIIPDWDREVLANMRALIAQLHNQNGDYRSTVEYLETAIPFLDNQDKKTRAFFLLGQSLESLGLMEQALFPYRAISDYRASFEIEYHAKRKEAEISRNLGYFDLSERILRRMIRDSKYITFLNELQYEYARTLQSRGDYESALAGYEEVIEGRFHNPSSLTLAKTYYALAEIYRDHYKDFQEAATYFELSATQRVDASLLPDNFNAVELANSFGRYANLKSQISERDSLLALANMSDEELKDFILEIQRVEQERVNQAARETRRQQERNTRIAESEMMQDIDSESEFGFLNTGNRELQLEASLQFQAIWGDRALADNWRRRDAVSGSRFDRFVLTGEMDEEIVLLQDESGVPIRSIVELSHIPFSEEEQSSLRREIENLHYQLGNVFFLTLNLPDSAKVYYHKVIDSNMNSDLVTMSMYSMAELELSQENEPEAFKWFEALAGYNPGSSYTRQLALRLEVDFEEGEDSGGQTTAMMYDDLMRNQQNLSPADLAERILELAEMEQSEERRARLFLNAANEYMKAAQHNMRSTDSIRNWILTQDRFESERARFEQLRDSSRVMLMDTTLTEPEREYWLEIADSSLSEPDFNAIFPYQGAYWDSTRTILTHIEDRYASISGSLMPRVRALRQELRIPETAPATIAEREEVIAFVEDRTEEPPVSTDEVQETRDQETIATLERQEQRVEREEEVAAATDAELAEERQDVREPETVAIRERPEETVIRDDAAVAESDEGADEDTPVFEESYTIVLFSFRIEESARTTVNGLKEAGYDTFLCPRLIDEDLYWRVSVGSFTEMIDAIHESRRLEEPYNAQNFISSTNISCESFADSP